MRNLGDNSTAAAILNTSLVPIARVNARAVNGGRCSTLPVQAVDDG